MEDEQVRLGSRFWLPLLGIIVAIGIAGLLLFILVGRVWYTYGVLGALIFLFAMVLLFGWLYDKREARRRANIEY